MLSFEQASSLVREKIQASRPQPASDRVPLAEARGRILGEDIAADRDYPPFHRATRDGFAVSSTDVTQVPATLEVVGLARAGHPYTASAAPGPGGAVEIMTGAPLPEGMDAVVMVEYTRASGASGAGSSPPGRCMEALRSVQPFENVVRRGSEAAAGNRVLPRGRRLGPGEIGLAASVGRAELSVFRRPQVAILPTGDEVVPADQQPAWFEVRNSNAIALAAQVEAAGGMPNPLAIAPDDKEALRSLMRKGLESDLLVLTGGISVGKYDFVAEALDELGAEFYLQGVAIRPGKPLAFGRAQGRFFFALPGNPVSTFVTFELFVRPAIALLGGAECECPVFLKARLGAPVRPNAGLSTFMPARVQLEGGDPVVRLVGWQGSGDLVGLAEANCFLVIHPAPSDLAPGDWVDVLPRGSG